MNTSDDNNSNNNQIRFNVTVYEADDLFTICKAKTKISHTTWSWL